MHASAFRLPRHVVPHAYTVSLAASPQRAAFEGTVHIEARVATATARVVLHARGLKIGAAQAKMRGRVLDAEVDVEAADEAIVLSFAEPLTVGEVCLGLHFFGQLNANMHGLYLAQDGPARALVSQCEATDARAIFPCFDEPDLKATLTWRVLTDPDVQVISNGVARKRRRLPGMAVVEHRFAPTRPISTYLAAVTVGHLEAGPKATVAGVPCQIWSAAGGAEHGQFALDVTAFVLPWYSGYFGQAYNYQKLDQVAVPGFDAGAMENVGAIFYRRNLLLVQPASASWPAQKRVAEVVAHEIAHQWFGNLVTMRWWDDLWLNEAFATWIAYKVCAIYRPDWRIWDDYLDGKEAALAADALRSTHPVYTPVDSPAQATEMFDVITYEKGCGILRMVEAYLGEAPFRRGIRAYIAAHRDGNAEGADLWNALAKASGQPVDALMRSWVHQPGFPLISARLERRGGRQVVLLRQARFTADGKPAADDKAVWLVPITLRFATAAGSETVRTMMSGRTHEVTLPPSASGAWAYPNDEATGFFRLRLEPALLRGILASGLTALAPAARMALLEDQWAQVRCGLGDVGHFCTVLKAFAGERDHAVVRTLVGRLHALNQTLVEDDVAPLFAAFVRALLGPQLAELGWQGGAQEAPPQAVRRALLVQGLGELGQDPEVNARARTLAEEERRQPAAVEPNLAQVVVALSALTGNAALLRANVATYRGRAGGAPELQARYLAALTATARPSLAARVHALCLDGTVPQEQLRGVLVPRLRRRATQAATWAFLKRAWATLAPKVGAMGIASLVESTGALPPAQADDVRRFFAAHPVPEATRALDKALEALALRRALLAREGPKLRAWLNHI